jgi:hypothetical protein
LEFGIDSQTDSKAIESAPSNYPALARTLYVVLRFRL